MSGHDRVRRQYEVARGSGSSCRGWQSSQLRGQWRRSTREMAASKDKVEGSFSAYSGRRKELPLSRACAETIPSLRLLFSNLRQGLSFSVSCGGWPVCVVACSWAPEAAASGHRTGHPTGASTRCCFCAVALKHVVFCRPSVRIGMCGTWARPHIFLRTGTPMKQTGTALSARASAAACNRRARGSICTASGTAEGSRPLVSQAPRPHDTAC